MAGGVNDPCPTGHGPGGSAARAGPGRRFSGLLPEAASATATDTPPGLLVTAAALAASCAFMLPVATPPNAIIFATGKLRIIDMVKTGFLLNFAGIVVVTLVTYFWGTLVFGIDVNSFPDWAVTITPAK